MYYTNVFTIFTILNSERELYALRRGTSTHLSVRKESAPLGDSGLRLQLVSTSKDETQTDLGGTLPNDGRVRGH